MMRIASPRLSARGAKPPAEMVATTRSLTGVPASTGEISAERTA
jgi:hypothetical protein